MARPKKPSIEYTSIEECNHALRALLRLTLRLEKVDADRALEVAQAHAKFEKNIDGLKEQIAEIEEALQAFYMAHHEEVEEGDRKSVPLYWGVLGRRLPPASLKPLNRSWSWKAIAVKVRSQFGARFFTQPEPALDKEQIKAELDEETLKKCGMRLEQEDDFYYELNRDRQVEA